MQATTYQVVSKIIIPNHKLSQIFSVLKPGQTISSKFLFEQHKEKLLSLYRNENTIQTDISRAIKNAREEGLLQRHDDLQIPEWFTQLQTVSYWQSQLRGNKQKNNLNTVNSTKHQYLYHLWNFNKWLSNNTFSMNLMFSVGENRFEQKTETRQFKNIEELFELGEQPFAVQKNTIRIIKQYLLDGIHKHKKASYLDIIKYSIASYFTKNEQHMIIPFDSKVTNNFDVECDQSMSLSELMEFLTTGRPSITEKALFLCKFHRGLDVSTLVDRFNYEAWEQIVKWFGSEDHNSWDLEKCPVPISLTRIKTDYKHVGFLERDSIDMLQKYLEYRKSKTGVNMQNGLPLFLNKFKKPINTMWVIHRFSVLAKRSGIQKYTKDQYGKKFFKVDSHELRDLLKSTLIDSGCRIDVAGHVIGHKPKDSYEKQSTLYPETLRKEYAKASKRLNIFTKFSNVVSGKDDSDELKLQLKEKIAEVDSIVKQQKESVVTRYQDEFFAKNQQTRMDNQDKVIEELKQTVNELKSKEKSQITDESEKLEFCCIGCEMVHDKESCPACGSKQRRIYEEKVKN